MPALSRLSGPARSQIEDMYFLRTRLMSNLALSMQPLFARWKRVARLKRNMHLSARLWRKVRRTSCRKRTRNVGMWWCNADHFLTTRGDKYLSPPLFFITVILNDKKEREKFTISCLLLCGHWLAVSLMTDWYTRSKCHFESRSLQE